MAIHWHWAFGNETSQVLQDNAGWTWTLPATGGVPTTVDTYTYSGSPTRYSMGIRGDGNRGFTCPAAAFPLTNGMKGAISWPLRHTLGNWLNTNFGMEVQSTDLADTSGIYIRYSSSALAFYIDDVLKGTSAPFDWQDWHYVTVKYDMTTTTWAGELLIDGVSQVSATDTASAAVTAGQFVFKGGSNATDTEIGQIITYDDDADATPIRFVTRTEGNADGTNIGTWVPQGGGTDFAELDSPIDPTTYTEETSPSASDRVEILTNGGGSDLATALGTTPGVIDSVCVHQISSGQNITGRAICGDSTGVTETPGPTVAIGATPGYSVATANVRPTGGVAWTGSDAPELIMEVVSI